MTDHTQEQNIDPDQVLEELFETLDTEEDETGHDPKTVELLALLDGPFSELRDDTFPDPDSLLVYDPEAAPLVQSLTFDETTTRYKCGLGGRWVPEDLERIKKAKRQCLQETLDSYYRHDHGESENLVCSTPCLVIRGKNFPHSWVTVKACIS